MSTVYIVDSSNRVEAVNYNELISRSIETTTSPRGVEAKLHVRSEVWYRVDNVFFVTEAEALENIGSVKGDCTYPIVEKVIRYCGWTWGHQGNSPHRLRVFGDEEESIEWLERNAEIDFKNDCDAPLIFQTRTLAEAWAEENQA